MVGNPDETEGAISLHIYSPPYTKCFCYKQDGSKNLVTIGEVYSIQNPFVEKSLATSVPNLKVKKKRDR